MTITLNGTPHPLAGETTVAGLLESLGPGVRLLFHLPL